MVQITTNFRHENRPSAAAGGLGLAIWPAIFKGVLLVPPISHRVSLHEARLPLWVQWRLISSAHKRYRSVRIHSDGTAQLLDNSGEWHSATLCKECIVLSTFAWLKLKPAQGGTYCELMRGGARGNSRENQQWRRLQVIWRHLGTVGRSC